MRAVLTSIYIGDSYVFPLTWDSKKENGKIKRIRYRSIAKTKLLIFKDVGKIEKYTLRNK
jgi:hypothetical protein